MDVPARDKPESAGAAPMAAGRLLAEAAAIGVLAVATILVSTVERRVDVLLRAELAAALTVVAVAAAVAGASLWAFVARLAHDGRARWGSAALGLYGLIAIPATTVGSTVDAGRAITGSVRIIGHFTVAMMFVVSAWPAVRSARCRPLRLFAYGACVCLAAAALAAVWPGPMLWLANEPAVRFTVIGIWSAAGFLIAVDGAVAGRPLAFRAGSGVVLLASAHLLRVATEAPQGGGSSSLAFCGLRLVALTIVLVVGVQTTHRVLGRLAEARRLEEELLRQANDEMARRTERDDEMRSGISSLAFATAVAEPIGRTLASPSRLATEIARLSRMVSHQPHRPDAGPQPEKP